MVVIQSCISTRQEIPPITTILMKTEMNIMLMTNASYSPAHKSGRLHLEPAASVSQRTRWCGSAQAPLTQGRLSAAAGLGIANAFGYHQPGWWCSLTSRKSATRLGGAFHVWI